MHAKNIKRIIRKQLKQHFPNWSRLKRKTKKEIIREVKAEVRSNYDFEQEVTAPKEELLGIEQQVPTKGILTLDEMASFIKMINSSNIKRFCKYNGSAQAIKDGELRFIHELIDDQIINRLLSYDGYSPAMRDIFPSNLFRAELLKAIQFPEISYRKFCKDKYFGVEQKENRAFMGLSLREKTIIDHTQLSQFRKSLSFVQQINLLVYILHHFMKSGLLADNHLHAVDSTELASDCRLPLASFEINGQKIRIYNDLDCDCGRRRNKRDKSIYVIGYRLHTLTAIDPKTGLSFPLVSLLAPANHHDSHFLPFLVKLAQAMGIDVKLITADEAYHDKDGSLFADTGASVVTPPSSKVSIPENVDPETGIVLCHDQCPTPMLHLGVEDQLHEYKCAAEAGECPHAGNCPQSRNIQLDGGMFQRIPYHLEQVQQVLDIRKNCERPFNLLKNQTGLETVRVRSQHATMARCTLSSIAVLLIKMAGKRTKQTPEKSKQMPLFAYRLAA
jgi:phage-related protein